MNMIKTFKGQSVFFSAYGMKRKLMCLFFVCLILVVVAGCGPQESTNNGQQATQTNDFAVITDDNGRTVALKDKPQRIVVLSASFLEPLHEVGGSVVGRPDSRTFMPEYAKDAASVGKVYQIDAEKVIALNPDLVIINKGMNEKLGKTCEDNGINYIIMDMKDYDSVKHELETFAQITGELEKAQALIESMDNSIKTVQDKLPKDKKQVAILHSTAQGLTIQLDGSIAGSIAKMLGWTNVASGMTALDKNPDAAPYSLETLIEKNPEILFVTSMGSIDTIKKDMESEMASNPAWQSVPAVAKGQVYYLPQDQFLLSPGIHYPEAVEYMAKLIYPNVFAGK